MTTTDAIEHAVVTGACRALSRRAALLRKQAADLTTSIEHRGCQIPIAEPEATVALGTARLFEECATDLVATFAPRPTRGLHP